MKLHDQRDWDQIGEDMRFVRDNSDLTGPEIYARLKIPRSQYSRIIKHNGCGLSAAKRTVLTELVNLTREKMGQEPLARQLSFAFNIGEQVDLESPQVNVSVLRKTETVWTVEVRLTQGKTA
jgi:hypothetical protein